ncbi:phospholipase D [Pochonia chlamydosporia 170]|uniref:Phospholipase D n=1 Tax=Pochonia chlamydosporia 170 TaxID=1380566 RepID=A0A179FL42_METCM|nr:phospholipase D [Pochonia chlamydosporia 170]OAQ66355.1 phospholipase D [Pochonia chlamydosporia 170]
MVLLSKLTSLCTLATLISCTQVPTVKGTPAESVDINMQKPGNLTKMIDIDPGITPNPFYAIAYRTLSSKSVKKAIKVGANALHLDVVPRVDDHVPPGKFGWFTERDDKSPTKKGRKVKGIFDTIAGQRKKGKNITFVWLAVHNPDFCTPHYHYCSFAALRDLAREILQPKGIHVLYGFPSVESEAYKSIQGDLNDLEAVSINGQDGEVKAAFEQYGPKNVTKRIMSYGYKKPAFHFGNCTEERYYICSELKKGAESKSEIGKTFGWTLVTRQTYFAYKLMEVNVDGLVFGFRYTEFGDSDRTRSALRFMKNWVERHPHVRYMATNDDKPWAKSRY